MCQASTVAVRITTGGRLQMEREIKLKAFGVIMLRKKMSCNEKEDDKTKLVLVKFGYLK